MHKFITLLVFLSSVFMQSAFANEEDEMAAMQKKLNAEVMEQPFLAEEPEKVEAYIQESLKKKIKPPPYRGNYWRPGYTCHDLLRYNWREYRNCMYYYRYYGHYY